MNRLDIEDGLLLFDERFLTEKEADNLFSTLENDISWEQKEILMFGKKVLQPRLHAWYGDEGIAYSYSGLKMTAEAWTPKLLALKTRIEVASQAQYNSVLLNFYRDGSDSMGWHSDDEKELGENPVIASLSLGGIRRFDLKHKSNQSLKKVSLDLSHGSLLIMAGATQHHWKHQIPKTKREVQPRINLTFRKILS